ncbi:MAG: oxaloacetate decarboxylase subunit gamma [Syntrophomonadaceae bacterium]|jgi:Na+-transporting methylmalonyl-CoA/oxaloacetate decarboxylase gamma subunit|nr:oxaloacetate decarboxylase subunit gamma [Syntrophomonadaceae bacterium]
MIDWATGLKCFVSGVVGVFLVMVFLQLAVTASSKLAQAFDKPKEPTKQAS